jgi:biotin carboxyl carrier protein
MKRAIHVNGKPGEIEIFAPPPVCRFRIDFGAERKALVEAIAPGVYSVLLDGRSYHARIENGEVFVNGYRITVDVHDPRAWSRGASAGAGEGVQLITSPMPGKVVRVLVAPGDPVQAGQGLVVVEAMKMQNEMRAPRAGKALTVSAKEGATVNAGETLVTLE